MSRSYASLSIALLPALAVCASAQDIVFSNPVPTAVGFGFDAIIVGDFNGGGRRDVVISTSGTTELRLMFSEAPAGAGVSVGNGLGTQLASLGNVSGGPADEFVSVGLGFAILWSDVGGVYTALGGVGFAAAGIGPAISVGDLTGDLRPEIAVGDPAGNTIHILDVFNFVSLYTITDPRVGSLGASLATGGTGVLAAGAPTWSNTVPPVLTVGYVNILRLFATTSTLAQTIVNAPAAVAQEFGRSIASVGDVTGDGVNDFAVLSPSTLGAAAFVSLVSSASGAIVSPVGYGVGTPAGVGRIAPLGDIDGDNLSDVTLVAGGSNQAFTTTGGALVALPIASPVLAYDGALTGGPDVFNQGFDDVLVGQSTLGAFGVVQVLPIAAWRNLPNPPICVLQPPMRPILGTAPYPLTVTTTDTNPLTALLVVDFAPAVNIPFGGGISYINLAGGTANVLGFGGVVAGAPLTFTGIALPASTAFLNIALVFQASTIDGTGTFQVSNGLLIRLGAF